MRRVNAAAAAVSRTKWRTGLANQNALSPQTYGHGSGEPRITCNESPLRFFRMISAFTRPLITMKTPSRFTRIFTILATVSMAAVAVAQPPPGGPGGPFGPGPGRGPGRPGFGPGPRPPLVELLVPPPPLYYHHHRYYSGDSGSSTVSRVQRALKTRGYYSGPVDGDAGSGTRAGIRSFREDNGLRSSTKIDGALLGALGL